MTEHRLLRRQLGKAGIDQNALEPVSPEALEKFLASVEASYSQADEYRTLQDHALKVSSREMAELNSRIESDRLEQRALREVATAVAEGQPAEVLFGMVAERAGTLISGDAARIFRLEGQPPEYVRPVGSWGRRENLAELIPEGGLPLAASPAAREALLARTALSMPLVRGYDDPCADHLLDLGICFIVSSPIFVDGRLWGALTVMSENSADVLQRAELSLARFASLTSVAIVNAEAQRRLEELASVDHLTGLWSRRIFQEELPRQCGRALESAGHLALVLIDFDDFKLVNDQLGHQVGDQVLRTVARLLKSHSPEGAILARLGGDEFAWLLPGFSASRAAELIENFQRELSSVDLGPVGFQTLSAGVCDVGKAGGESAELYRMADGALYSAKRSRPGSCVVYRPDTELPHSVDQRRAQLERSRGLQAVRALARAVDARDPLTHSHSERVADLSAALAGRVGWDSIQRDALYEAALVHDVGKIGVPDALLRFPGPLSADEMEMIRSHAAMGAEIVAGLLSPEQVSWVRHHHERWDGQGYPDRLGGVFIPEGARIMAIADSFDAIVSDRPYRAGRDVEPAVEEMRASAGTQFDSELLLAFTSMWEDRHPLLVLPRRSSQTRASFPLGRQKAPLR